MGNLVLIESFERFGFDRASESFYKEKYSFSEDDWKQSLIKLQNIFESGLLIDQDCSFRKRAYLKLKWSKSTAKLEVPSHQTYYQSTYNNNVDGGKIRKFKIIDKEVLELPIIQSIFQKNISLIRSYPTLKNENNFIFGLHFIRYESMEGRASYS